jgi:ubiquitin-like-conjugating enzyme ATG10
MESFDCPIKDYLMLWVGLVGGCVGLWIPPEMARGEGEGQESDSRYSTLCS